MATNQNPTVMATLYPFDGIVQHYAWGGYDYLPELLEQSNDDRQPWAELWMGAHPKGPGQLDNGDTLEQLIAGNPVKVLGKPTAERFDDRLPFLFKVLDVREMLSIQVHPNKAAAEKGFAREEKNGPDVGAPDRNYRDDNHKPELGIALTDFYLLHGFRSTDSIRETLDRIPGWDELSPTLDKDGVEGLYARVMRADAATIDRLLGPLSKEVAEGSYGRDEPRYWAKRAFEHYTTEDGHYDRGIFSIFWFNLVKLSPGQGIFQDAGIPHAYLEGVCIELMANSDNVLRGGLTPKHIDVSELLDKTRFKAVDPELLDAETAPGGWSYYPTSAPDFKLLTARPASGSDIMLPLGDKPGILFLLDGELEVGTIVLDAKQRTLFMTAGADLSIRARSDSRVYLATVGI